MIPNWASHIKDPDEKKRFINYVYQSRGLLERLSDILKGMDVSSELDQSSYDSPSWAAKQADNNGYRRCLREIQKLITLDQKEH